MLEHESLDVFAEQNVHPIKRDGAAADDGARRNGAPENICTREPPDRQQGSEHGHQNARTRDPERKASDFRRIQVAPFFWGWSAH